MNEPELSSPGQNQIEIIPADEVDQAANNVYADYETNSEVTALNIPVKQAAVFSSGRRSKLTPAVFKKIENALIVGSYDDIACQLVNINRATFNQWISKGRDIAESENPDENDIYYQFYLMVERSRAVSEVKAAAVVVRALTDDARLALDFLSRRFPQRWARNRIETGRANDESTNSDQSEIQIGMSEEKRAEKLMKLLNKAQVRELGSGNDA